MVVDILKQGVRLLIICVAIDDKMGMIFNNRRQSQDRLLRADIMEDSKDSKLWMNEYTYKQFETPLPDNIIVDEDFLNKAEDNDYCFVENLSLTKYEEHIKQIVLYKWNRVYPADTYFDISLLENGWQLSSVAEFKGNSHEKITKEEWINGRAK